MIIPADQLISAVESEDLSAQLFPEGDGFVIAIMICGKEVERVGCLRTGCPTVKVSFDGRSVDVFPSPGVPDGFSIGCRTHDEAMLIADTLSEWLTVAYLDFGRHIFHQAIRLYAMTDSTARFPRPFFTL